MKERMHSKCSNEVARTKYEKGYWRYGGCGRWFIDHEKWFDIWFEKRFFKYSDHSMQISNYCPKHFHKWWDVKLFNERNYIDLINHCGDYFDIWWDDIIKNTKKIEYYHMSKLIYNFPDKIDKWIDYIPDTCWYSHQYTIKNFNKWFNFTYKLIPANVITENSNYRILYRLWFEEFAKEEDKLFLINKFGVINYERSYKSF